jgi:amino acid transporter
MQGSTAFTAWYDVGDYHLYCSLYCGCVSVTGMVNYSELNVGDPLAFVFHKLDLKWMSSIVAVSAVIAMASVYWFSKWVNRVYG